MQRYEPGKKRETKKECPGMQVEYLDRRGVEATSPSKGEGEFMHREEVGTEPAQNWRKRSTTGAHHAAGSQE